MSSILTSNQTTKTSVSASYIYRADLFPATTLVHAPLEAVYIYFDTATYDEIERDVKVAFLAPLDILLRSQCSSWQKLKGNSGGSIGAYRRHDGPSHWLLHPQWG